MMNLHHLSIFAAVAGTGSLTASARKLHISQPALSRELKTFEGRLGVTLFERHSRGMRLTQAGEVLHHYAKRLFELERAAETTLSEIAGARRGRLAIGASNTIGTYVLPRLLAAFRAQRPEVEVSVFVGNTEQVSEGVDDMRFNLGFIEGPLHRAGLHAAIFQQDEIVPVAAPGHPLLRKRRLTPADVSGQPLLVRESGSGTREVVAAALARHGVVKGRTMELGNTEALKRAAMHGGGIAWLPRICMVSEVRAGTLRELPLRELTIVRPLMVLSRDGAPVEPAAAAFLQLLHGQ
ncbi:MAG TPA: LysR family transcriptional regulator [Steroidobacteraceae bacterium]|jgi:DNA-binding transcriptional LysR family regulator|nr:LysR family transcriptional regulator [Steroidobacteraceae bacterium]